MEVFKLANGNAIKRLCMRKKTHEVTRNGKTAEAIFEQIASQEFREEKKGCKYRNK